MLDLTNGRTWALRESGWDGLTHWDWQVSVESWGCANGHPGSQ
jgi:hypothetical protein